MFPFQTEKNSSCLELWICSGEEEFCTSTITPSVSCTAQARDLKKVAEPKDVLLVNFLKAADLKTH